MMSEEHLANVGRWLKEGRAKTVFDMWEKYLSADFADGDKGWQLYKECWTMVHRNAPHDVAEFQRRFSHLPHLEETKRTIPTASLTQTARMTTEELQANKSWFSQLFSA